MQQPTDDALMQSISRGDEAALGALYDRYSGLSFSLACRVVGDDAIAQDVLQESYIKVWRMAKTYNPARGAVKAWLLAIVHHQAIDYCRKRRATMPIDFGADESPHEPAAPEDTWSAVKAKLDQESLSKALDAIPVEQRRTIELAFFKGYTHQEIADLAHLPLGTVKSRIRIGMEKLRDLLIKERVDL